MQTRIATFHGRRHWRTARLNRLSRRIREGLLYVGAGAVLGLIFAVADARAEDRSVRAQTPNECALFADVAIVARAMVEQRVEAQAQRPVLEAIYRPSDIRIGAAIDAILEGARRAEQPAADWATALGQHCMQRAGRLEPFLGVAL